MPKVERAAVALRRSSRFQPQELTPKTKYYKLLSLDMWHRGFQYKEGLNVDHVPFNPKGDCQPGGLYYTTLEHVPLWYSAGWPLIADVTIPADARVYAEPCGRKWKADCIELSNIRTLDEFMAEWDKATVHDMVAGNARMFVHVKNQTKAMCLLAVRVDPDMLYYVKNQTKDVCRAAIDESYTALQHVRKQDEDLCLEAVHRCGLALAYVRKQTEAICRAALRWYPEARRFVEIPLD